MSGECTPRWPPKSIVIISTAFLAALTGITLWNLALSDSAAKLWLDIAVAIVCCVLAPVSLRWPAGAGITAGLLSALSPTATVVATAAALNAARSRRGAVALAVAGIGLAGQAVQGLWRPASGLSYWWRLLLFALAYAALFAWGALAQSRQRLLDSLRERADRAEAEQALRIREARVAERARLARDMHDVLAHRLSLLATYAGALEYRPDAPPEQLAAAAGVVRAGVHQALDELREVIGVLRDDDGTAEDAEAGEPLLTQVSELIDESRDAGVTVDLHDRLDGSDEIGPVTGRTAVRVVQEGLTNARKHAAGQPVTVVLDGTPGTRLEIDVRNPLVATAASVPGAGIGLIGLTERVQLAGGQLDHGVHPSGEFRLHVWLPWRI